MKVHLYQQVTLAYCLMVHYDLYEFYFSNKVTVYQSSPDNIYL